MSKIIATNIVGLLSLIAAFYGLPVDPASQAAIVSAIMAVTSAVTIILRIWFNRTK